MKHSEETIKKTKNSLARTRALKKKATRKVVYDNRFNSYALNGFSTGEMNLLMTALHLAKNKGTQRLEFDYSLVKTLCGYKGKDKKQFQEYISEASKRITGTVLMTKEEELDSEGISVFSRFRANGVKEVLELEISENYSSMINDNSLQFTTFELERYVKHRRYAKETMRRLEQFSDTGVWNISLEDFRFLMDIPNLEMKYITKQILTPMLEELRNDYPDLEIEKIRKGRKIDRLIFRWTPVKRILPLLESPEEESSSKLSSELTGTDETNRCPVCGKPLIRRKSRNGYFWGHEKYTEGCSKTYDDDYFTKIEESLNKAAALKEKADIENDRIIEAEKKAKSKVVEKNTERKHHPQSIEIKSPARTDQNDEYEKSKMLYLKSIGKESLAELDDQEAEELLEIKNKIYNTPEEPVHKFSIDKKDIENLYELASLDPDIAVSLKEILELLKK